MVSFIHTQSIIETATLTGLPDFFQTDEHIIEESLEESIESESGDSIHSYPSNLSVNMSSRLTQIDEINVPDDEKPTDELLEFFRNVRYEDMAETLRYFEFGNTWESNPIFTDEFSNILPKTLSTIVYELHDILHIQRVVPSDWNRNDCRYTSLSVPQQSRLKELIHESSSDIRRLRNVYNRLNEYERRTPYPFIVFLMDNIVDVVQDILNIDETQL